MFCVAFDYTGQRIITVRYDPALCTLTPVPGLQGADDDLIKVWDSGTGQLMATFRGHSAEITDMSMCWDNSMIATGSLDKTVRVWCARTATPINVLTGHSGHITSVQVSYV